MSRTKYDVIVVGAGLAGLSAANVLQEKGLKYKIIEASDRAGGKVQSVVRPDGSRSFELGAQFINRDMEEMVNLAREAGFELSEKNSGDGAVEISFPSYERISDAVHQHEEQLEDIQEKLNGKDERLSDLFERMVLNETEMKVVKSIYAELMNIAPHKLSAKAVLDLTFRFPSDQDDLTHQLNAPLAGLVTFMERGVAEHLIYNEPIERINSTSNGYELVSAKKTYKADSVIVAVPPAVSSKLTLSPTLEKHYRQALDSYVDGSIIKTTWVYDSPFWHDYEVKGQGKGVHDVVFTEPQGVTVVDSSKEGGEYCLTMFIGANTAIDLAQKKREERLETATSWLENVFGKGARSYKDVEQSVWVEDHYCGGGYGAGIRYGAIPNAAEVLRTPKGRMVFASSELAEEFPYYMEGAVRAGKVAVNNLFKS
ncbi:flavin monoamine oxidase family protein [Alteribacter aurantiacus]|uniref:flavin monoamine oxidase family protein n=1 Tax=Alteribacter aurantiacus TaxID=254410 RepID=UPI000418A7DD|nr:FAD-dependent oxidoreductase [Alteribacter aurantiacus]